MPAVAAVSPRPWGSVSPWRAHRLPRCARIVNRCAPDANDAGPGPGETGMTVPTRSRARRDHDHDQARRAGAPVRPGPGESPGHHPDHRGRDRRPPRLHRQLAPRGLDDPPAPAHPVRGAPVGGLRLPDRVGRPGQGEPGLGRLLPHPDRRPPHHPLGPRGHPRPPHQHPGRVRRAHRPGGHARPPRHPGHRVRRRTVHGRDHRARRRRPRPPGGPCRPRPVAAPDPDRPGRLSCPGR